MQMADLINVSSVAIRAVHNKICPDRYDNKTREHTHELRVSDCVILTEGSPSLTDLAIEAFPNSASTVALHLSPSHSALN